MHLFNAKHCCIPSTLGSWFKPVFSHPCDYRPLIWEVVLLALFFFVLVQVARHLAKLFDSMAQLKFVEKDGKPTDEAVGMYSKDGEYVDFDKPCICVGQVIETSSNGVLCTSKNILFGLAFHVNDFVLLKSCT